MSASFDNELRKKLEEIRPEDAGLTFDKLKVWESISRPKNKKVLPFRIWITHAAAVAAGILVGIWFFTKEQPVAPENIANKSVSKTIIPSSGNVEMTTKTKDKINPSAASPINSTIAKHQSLPVNVYVANSKEEHVVTMPENGTVTKSIIEEPLIAQQATPTQKHKKVLHLADIMNENDHIVNTPEIRYKSVWARLIPEETNNSESNPESFTMAVGNFIKNKRN